MTTYDVTQQTKIQDFINDLTEAQGWSNSPVLSLNKSNWEEQFVFTNTNARFIRITELSSEEEATLRQDLENVISCLDNPDFCLVYYISGTPEGIELYLGVIDKAKQTGIHEYAQLLTSQLEGNLTGVQFDKVSYEDLGTKIIQPLKESKNFGLLHGVPSRSLDQQSQTGQNITQGIDRLARGLANETWQMILVAEPATEPEVNQQINNLLQLSSDLHPFIKQSHQVGTNESQTSSTTTGSSTSYGLTTNTGKNWSDTQGTGQAIPLPIKKVLTQGVENLIAIMVVHTVIALQPVGAIINLNRKHWEQVKINREQKVVIRANRLAKTNRPTHPKPKVPIQERPKLKPLNLLTKKLNEYKTISMIN